jgi:hypothetical protein
VAIGDSETWGVNATSLQAWPARLQALTGCSVYNMSVGGFGMVQYAAMPDEALSLRPRLVVVGLYLGNDLYDSYSLAYSRPFWQHLRLAGRPDLLTDATRAKADAAWNDEKRFQYAYGRDSPRTWGLWLRAHTAVGRLLERAGVWPGRDAWFEIGRACATAHPESGSYYDDGRLRTVFTVGYRLVALDLEDPRIAEGLRLTSELLAQRGLGTVGGHPAPGHRKTRRRAVGRLSGRMLGPPTSARSCAARGVILGGFLGPSTSLRGQPRSTGMEPITGVC